MREEAHKGRMCPFKEGFWIWPDCVLVFLRVSCTLRPWFAEVKNTSPVSQPSTYSGFSEVVVLMAQSRSLYKLISWSHVLLCGFAFSLASCVYCSQAQVAFLQGERKGQENMKQDLVRRIKMLEYALKQERYDVPVSLCRISNALEMLRIVFFFLFVCNSALMWSLLGLQGQAPEAEDRKWPESRRQEAGDRGRATYVWAARIILPCQK